MPALPESPIRQVFSNGPTKDVNGTDMACGVGSTGVTTKDVAQVSAGSEVQFQFGPVSSCGEEGIQRLTQGNSGCTPKVRLQRTWANAQVVQTLAMVPRSIGSRCVVLSCTIALKLITTSAD